MDYQGATSVAWVRLNCRAPRRSTIFITRRPCDYLGEMTEPITPKQLSAELGVSDRAVRQWLRDRGWQSVPYTRWELTSDQAAEVRAHFRS